ncbi:MAG: hypothetical protein M1831_004760 [Alyxoria varia]|nr:MAG: hypothetical protein M1831_004760 [Alyxoria varia]
MAVVSGTEPLDITKPIFADDTPEHKEQSDSIYSYLISSIGAEDSTSTQEEELARIGELAQHLVGRIEALPVSPWTPAEDGEVDAEDEWVADEHWEDELEFLWAIVCHYVKQIRPRHAYQLKLLLLLQQIRKRPNPAALPYNSINRGRPFWPRLEFLHVAYHRYEHYAPIYPPRVMREESQTLYRTEFAGMGYPEPKEVTPRQWTNLNSFIAQLNYMSNAQVEDLDKKGLYAVIDALEENLEGAKMDDLLPSAAEWILCSGKLLRYKRQYYNDTGFYLGDVYPRSDIYTGGPLWEACRPRLPNDARLAFSYKRWLFWQDRLRDISGRSDVSEATRETARKALDEMIRIDQELDDGPLGPLPGFRSG